MRAPSRPRAELLGSALFAMLVLTFILGQVGTSLALATDSESASATLGSDTLDPPSDARCAGLALCSVAFIAKPVLTWTASPDGYTTGYDIYRSTTNGSGYLLIASVPGRTTTTFTDTTVSAATTYYYVIRAHATVWTSGYSNQVTVIVLL